MLTPKSDNTISNTNTGFPVSYLAKPVLIGLSDFVGSAVQEQVHL